MIDASSTYDAELAKTARTPIHAVLLQNPASESETIAICTKQIPGGPFATAAETLRPLSLKRSSDPARARFQASEFRFEWSDPTLTADAAVADGIKGWRCTLQSSFFGLSWYGSTAWSQISAASAATWAAIGSAAADGISINGVPSFMAVSDSGALMSFGGAWTTETAPAANQWSSVCCAGKWIAVSKNLGATQVMNSASFAYPFGGPGTMVWTLRTAALNLQWSAVASKGTVASSRVLAVAAESTGTDKAMTSDDDGNTWTARTTGGSGLIAEWKACCWSEVHQRWFAAGTSLGGGTVPIMSSADNGVTWEECGLIDSVVGGLDLRAIAECPITGRVVAVGDGYFVSLTGPFSGTYGPMPLAHVFTGFSWTENGGGVGIAISAAGSAAITDNAQSWFMDITQPEANQWAGIAAANTSPTFLAVASTGSFRSTSRNLTPGFITRLTGTVSDARVIRPGVFEVTARSGWIAALDGRLWDAARSTLSGGIDNTVTVIPLDDETQFAGPGYLKIEDEIVYFAATPGGSGNVRGALGTTPASHSSGADAIELFYYPETGAPSTATPRDVTDILLDIMGGIGSAKSSVRMSSFIDAAGFFAFRAAYPMFAEFLASTGSTAASVIQEQFFQPMAAWPAENNRGQIRPIAIEGPASFTAAFTDANILGPPNWVGRYTDRLDLVRVDYSLEPGGDYARQASSGAAGGNEMLIRTQGYIADFAADRAAAWIAWSGVPPDVYEFEAFMATELVEIGDGVTLTTSNTFDPTTGLRELAGKECVVIEKSEDYARGSIRYRVMVV